MDKLQLRKHFRRQLLLQPEAQRQTKSQQIWQYLQTLPAYHNAAVVFAYVALPYEVQTLPMIRAMLHACKTVVVPRVASENTLELFAIASEAQLRPGVYGILEPEPDPQRAVAVCDLELALIPGIAFSLVGHRLGQGAGYFDRFLEQLAAPAWGLAYAFQLCEQLPVEAHDRGVQGVITEKGITEVGVTP
jgi:5-formyltetrahydrofolate cyclo-ligase